LITDNFVYISKNMLNDFGFEEKGERFVSVFTKMELDKLSVMYDGDKDRDSSHLLKKIINQKRSVEFSVQYKQNWLRRQNI